MLNTATQTLASTFSETLAGLAFMFVDGDPGQSPISGDCVECAIGYQGPCSGTLRLRCTREFAALLAANLLGIEPDDEAAHEKAQDALKELMNVLCGQFVTDTYGRDAVFNLSLPALQEMQTLPTDSPGIDRVILWVEGHPVELEHAAVEGCAAR